MADVEKSSLVTRLQSFYERLRDYRSLLFEDQDFDEAEELRQELVRENGAMRPVVEALIGERGIVQFGQPIAI